MAKHAKRLTTSPKAAFEGSELKTKAPIGLAAVNNSTRAASWGRGYTNAPLAEKEQPSTGYSACYATLIERLLKGQLPLIPIVDILLVLGWIGIVFWISLQDNQVGLLTSPDGIKRLAIKALALFCLPAMASVIIRFILWLTKTDK
jgi:hypothetical protein